MATIITILILVAVIAAAVHISRQLGPELAKSRAEEAATGKMFKWRSSGDYDTEVVGESFYKDDLAKLLGNRGETSTTAVLVPYEHPKDSNAVRVEIQGLVVGHLSRDDAPDFRRLLAKKHKALATSCCKAQIGGGALRADGTQAPIGVFLDIADFQQ